MEVKVYRKGDDGTLGIEAHSIPTLVGDSVTTGREDMSTTQSDSDSVDRVCETVEVGPAVGVAIRRRVTMGNSSGVGKGRSYGKLRAVIVTPEELAGEVTRVDVDGEQVWPAEEEGGTQPAPSPKTAPAPAASAEPAPAQAPARGPRAMADWKDLGPGLSAADEDYISRLIEDGLGI